MKPKLLDGLAEDKYLVAYAPRFAGSPSLRFVDPATVVAVVQAAMDLLEKKKFTDWQHDVSDQLAEINARLDQIVRMIQELRDHIDEQLRKTIVDFLGANIRAGCQQVEEFLLGIGARQLTSEERTALAGLAVPLRRDVGSLMSWEQYGFDGHYSVIGGALTLLGAYYRAEIPQGQRKAFIRNLIEGYLRPAQDPTNSKSLEADRNGCALTAIDGWNRLNPLLNRWWLFNVGSVLLSVDPQREPRDPPDPKWRGRAGIEGLVAGNPDAGFTYHQRAGSAPLPEWFPGIPEHYDMGDGFAKSSHWIDVYCIQPLANQIRSFTSKEAGLAIIVASIRTIIARLEKSPEFLVKVPASVVDLEENNTRMGAEGARQDINIGTVRS